jgi:hypothetical protein
MVESRRNLIGVGLYGCLAAALVWAIRPGGLAGLLAAPLLLVCPGYALSCALRDGEGTDRLEVAVRTVALSFASAALGGLALNVVGVRLDPRSWATLMLAITVAAGCVGIRRLDQPATARSRTRFGGRIAVVVGLAITAVLVVAAFVAYDSQRTLDRRHSATELSATVDHAAPHSLKILVGNSQAAAQRYRVLITGARARVDIPLTLRPGQVRNLVVRQARWSPRRPVTVALVRAAQPGEPYRSVTIR